MVKNYDNIQVKSKPDAIAVIKGSNSYSDINGTVYFYQANEGVLINANINGLPHFSDYSSSQR